MTSSVSPIDPIRRDDPASSPPYRGGERPRPGASLDPLARAKRDEIIYRVFMVNAVGTTFLQKFGIGFGGDAVLPVTLILLLGSVLYLLTTVRTTFDPVRIGLYFAWIICAAFGIFVSSQSFSTLSIGLFLLIYLPMLVSFPTTEANLRRCYEFFSNLMVAAAALTFAEHLIQLFASADLWPNLDKLVAKELLVQNYVYLQPIEWSSRLMKPNAVFFLEVSFLSQYITIALAIELLVFKRLWRILLFAGTIFATFAGTGLLLAIVTLPVMLRRMSIRNLAVTIVILTIVVVLAYDLGWVGATSHRYNEYQQHGSSANMRFVEPWNRIVEFARNRDAAYTGIGPGRIEKFDGFRIGYQWWPATKVILEYGFATGIIFYIFYLYAMFKNPPLPELAFVLAVWYSIEGALLTSVNVATCIILSSLFVVDKTSGTRRRRRRRSSSGEAAIPFPPHAVDVPG